MRHSVTTPFAAALDESRAAHSGSDTRIVPLDGWVAPTGSSSRTNLFDTEPLGAAARSGEAVSGRRVGRYRLIEPLGAGTQAIVWRALLEDGRNEEVALKLLVGPQPRDRHARIRLRREAARGARLDHPSILPVWEFGETEGVAYLVMELVEGWSLAEVLEARRKARDGRAIDDMHRLASLPDSEYLPAVVALLARVARGLHAAHEAKIVHRDVKPSNILLDRFRSGRAMLADFGLGRDLDVATPEQLRDWSGSPLYMAPEKLRGQYRDEIRCDIYALGVTLFEALTLQRPFDDREMPTGRACYWYLAGQRPLRAREVCPSLPSGLEATVMKAMARDPERRQESAEALAQELEAFLAQVSRDRGGSARGGRAALPPLPSPLPRWRVPEAVFSPPRSGS